MTLDEEVVSEPRPVPFGEKCPSVRGQATRAQRDPRNKVRGHETSAQLGLQR